MNTRVQRALAIAVVVGALAVEFPLQNSIDTYRNTFRVAMYPDARPQDVDAAAAKLQDAGLKVSRVTHNGAVTLLAPLPRSAWHGTHEKYITAVQNVPRVESVIPGLNEQGIPLDQVQQLNIENVGIIVMAALIGGFRKSAANVLWLQNDEDWHSGHGYRTVPLAKAVTLLDPNFVDAWVLTCWHLAYNMSVEAKDPDEAASLIRQGLEFAKGGIPWNSTRYEIYQEVGWTYYDKLQNYAWAAEFFKRAIEHPHPTFLERIIGHAYERIPDIDNALFWYKVSQEKYKEGDRISQGAIDTITERYVNAWALYKQKRYDEALKQLDEDWQKSLTKWAKNKPADTIYQHFRARIFEGMAEQPNLSPKQKEGFYLQAFEGWLKTAKSNSSDRLARRRVLTLAENFGWNNRVPPGFNDVGVPETWAKDLSPDKKGRAVPTKPKGEGAPQGGAPAAAKS